MCDEPVLRGRENQVISLVDVLKMLPVECKGLTMAMMLSWKTGAKEGKQSSYITAAEYVMGKIGTWVNVLDEAAIQDATTTEEIFNNSNYTPEQIAEGIERVLDFIRRGIRENLIIFLDRNEDPLFPNGKLKKKILPDMGFYPIARVFGDRAIFFVHETSRCLAVLKRPLGKAGESRNKCPVHDSIFCAMTIEVLKHIVAYLNDEPIETLETSESNALVGAYMYEKTIHGDHLGKRIASAMLRHALNLHGGTNSCIDNDLAKTPNVKNYPISDCARNVARGFVKSTERPVEHYIIDDALNILS